MIAAVVAIARGGVIGKENSLPWYLPADLKHFKALTKGHDMIMGRKTADSIIARIGHGLPHRKNIVITRDATYAPEGFIVVRSPEEALAHVEGDAYILGGAQIYELFLPSIEVLYLTEVHADIDGDVFFPKLNEAEWRETSREKHQADDKNQYAFDFVELQRVH